MSTTHDPEEHDLAHVIEEGDHAFCHVAMRYARLRDEVPHNFALPTGLTASLVQFTSHKVYVIF